MLIQEAIFLATLPTGFLGYSLALMSGRESLTAAAQTNPKAADGHGFFTAVWEGWRALTKIPKVTPALHHTQSDSPLPPNSAVFCETSSKIFAPGEKDASPGAKDSISHDKRPPANNKAAFPDRDSLLAELHHRVRNNFQIIISALNLQLRELRSEEAVAALQESINRITSFSLIQNLCYDASDTAEIDLGAHLAELRRQYLKVGDHQLNLSLIIEGPKLMLPLAQAIPCSMAISELLSASCKYGEQSGSADRYDSVVYVDFTPEQNTFLICLRGKPIHRVINLSDTSCLELRLCKALIGQLCGQIRFQPDSNNHSLSRVLIDGPLVR